LVNDMFVLYPLRQHKMMLCPDIRLSHPCISRLWLKGDIFLPLSVLVSLSLLMILSSRG